MAFSQDEITAAVNSAVDAVNVKLAEKQLPAITLADFTKFLVGSILQMKAVTLESQLAKADADRKAALSQAETARQTAQGVINSLRTDIAGI